MLFPNRELSLATSLEVYVVALKKKPTKTCNCGCSRHDLPFRRLTTLQTSLTKSNMSALQSHSHTVVRFFSCYVCGEICRQRAGVKGVVGTADKIIPQAEYFGKCGSK